MRKQRMIYPLGLVNTKQREFFFVSSFVYAARVNQALSVTDTVFLFIILCNIGVSIYSLYCVYNIGVSF